MLPSLWLFDLATAHMYFEIKEKHFDFSECI